jgi:hypothetical protein
LVNKSLPFSFDSAWIQAGRRNRGGGSTAMLRKITALAAAAAFALTSFAPVAADARDRRDGYHGRHYDYRHDYRRDRWRDRHDDDGAAVAAGVIGLVLGLAIGAAASQPREPRARCYDNYRRCDPPQQGYYDRGYSEQGYDPRYDDDRRSAYERDYGAPPPEGSYDPYYAEPQQPQCMRRERQWDRYANRYVTVDVPC